MRSAGVLLYRTGPLRVYLGHPGGPYYRRRQRGVWTIPKGQLEAGEDERTAALREFAEETGFKPAGSLERLGDVRYRSGKELIVFACEHRGPDFTLRSNPFEVTFPNGSSATFPELDAGRFVPIDEAKTLVHPVQRPLLEELERTLERMGERA